MGVKKRTYDIKIEMTGGKPVPVLKYDGKVMGPTDKLMFNKTDDKMKKVDHYRITFKIEDFGNSKLRFVPAMADVMWAQKGTSCPTSPCALNGVFWTDAVANDGEWIDVINMDMTLEDFWFTLNFCDKSITNPTQADYVALDPGGGNQNAGGSGSDFQSYAVVSTITGAAAAMLAAAQLSQELVAQNVLIYGLGGAALGWVVGLLFDRMRG
jgi:hypothetical protein